MTTKTGSTAPALDAPAVKVNGAVKADKNGKDAQVIPIKKRMTVAEKLESLSRLEGLASKIEYLRECKQKLDGFGTGQDGFQGARLTLRNGHRDEVTVGNPVIVEELVKIANMRLKDLLIKAEKEVEAFEIV